MKPNTVRHSRICSLSPSVRPAALLLGALALLLAVTSTAALAQQESQEPPAAPRNLAAELNGDGSVTLSWEAPDDDSVAGYQILRRRPYEGERTLLVYVEDTGGTATAYTDADVTAGTQHVYRVKALNGAGAGPQSNYVNVDVPDMVPDDPAPGDEDQQRALQDQQQEPQEPQDQQRALQDQQQEPQEPQDQQRALQEQQQEPQEPQDQQEEPREPPAAPRNLAAELNGDGSVTLSWEAPDDDSVAGYQILRRRPYEGERTLLMHVEDTGGTATAYTDADVTAGTQHVYRVKALNAAGAGPQSNYVNVDVPDTAEGDPAPGDEDQQRALQERQEPPDDEPAPSSKVVVADSDPAAEQQSAQAVQPPAPWLVENALGRIKIGLPHVEDAVRYEVTRITQGRTGYFFDSTYTRSITQSASPVFTDYVEWGRTYIYYYRVRFGGDRLGSYSNGSVRVTSEKEPHVTNRRLYRFKQHSTGSFVWSLSYRWDAPTGDAVGTLLGYTVQRSSSGRVIEYELGPRSTRYDGGFAATPGSGLYALYRIKVRYSTGDTLWSPYTIHGTDQSEYPETSYEEVGRYSTS